MGGSMSGDGAQGIILLKVTVIVEFDIKIQATGWCDWCFSN